MSQPSTGIPEAKQDPHVEVNMSAVELEDLDGDEHNDVGLQSLNSSHAPPNFATKNSLALAKFRENQQYSAVGSIPEPELEDVNAAFRRYRRFLFAGSVLSILMGIITIIVVNTTNSTTFVSSTVQSLATGLIIIGVLAVIVGSGALAAATILSPRLMNITLIISAPLILVALVFSIIGMSAQEQSITEWVSSTWVEMSEEDKIAWESVSHLVNVTRREMVGQGIVGLLTMVALIMIFGSVMALKRRIDDYSRTQKKEALLAERIAKRQEDARNARKMAENDAGTGTGSGRSQKKKEVKRDVGRAMNNMPLPRV
jgi:hypothetical protein